MSTQYLYRVNILSKKNNHPLDAIANYCGEDQFDLYTNQTYKSNNSEKIVWNNILIPNKDENFDMFQQLPEFLKIKSKKSELISNARNILWRQVDRREIRPDSQFARLFELSIPFFLNQTEAISLLHSFGKVLDEMLDDIFDEKTILDIDREKINQLKVIFPDKDENELIKIINLLQ